MRGREACLSAGRESPTTLAEPEGGSRSSARNCAVAQFLRLTTLTHPRVLAGPQRSPSTPSREVFKHFAPLRKQNNRLTAGFCNCGEGGSRTPEALTDLLGFGNSAFNHPATSPPSPP